jgi:hypothetical protein
MQHRLLRLLLFCAALLGSVVLLLTSAELAVRLEPVTAAVPIPEGDYVQLQADERIFTLFAALNAGGYDEENNEQGMSDVRLRVRAALAQPGGETPSLPAALRPNLAMCRFIHVSQYATWVLQRGPAPRFARAADGWALDAPAFLFFNFDRALDEKTCNSMGKMGRRAWDASRFSRTEVDGWGWRPATAGAILILVSSLFQVGQASTP